MNKVVSNEGTLTNGQPITNDTIPFIENGVQEAISNLVKGLLGSYSDGDVIILEGVVITISTTTTANDTATWTAGSLYFDGEIYTVVAGTVTKTGGQTFVFTNTEDDGPVVTFEDNSPHYPHRIRQVQLVAGPAGGSGVDDYISDYSTANVKRLYGADWHYVGGVGEPAFQNLWVAGTAGGGTMRFMKDSLGFVHIEGEMKAGNLGFSAFNLPVGFRPDRQFFPSAIIAGPGLAIMFISDDGEVTVNGYIASGNNTSVLLDIIFKAV